MNWDKIAECGHQRRINRNYYKYRKALYIAPVYGNDNEALRKSKKYWHWRRAVLSRDGFCCQDCGVNKELIAHHIKPFALHPKERFIITNGITLCNKCHSKKHVWLKTKPFKFPKTKSL